MNRKHPSYHYVTNKETDKQAYRIGDGKFFGYKYGPFIM